MGRVQYMLRSVTNDDGYRLFSATDPSGHFGLVFLKGDRSGQPKKLEGAAKRLTHFLEGKYPQPPRSARRSEGLLIVSYRKFLQVTVAPRKTDSVWNPRTAA